MAEKRKFNKKKPEQATVYDPLAQYGNQPPTFEQVWLLFRETDRQFKESEKLLTEKFQETDKLLTEKFQKTDKKFQESEKLLTEKFQETDRQFKETDKKIKDLSNLFTSQWGRLVESLVEGAIVRLLNEAGIAVSYTSERVKGCVDGENFEFDILAHNGEELVVVEVKTTLRPSDVKDFLAKMKKFRTYLPNFRYGNIMGGMAFLRADAGAATMAQKEGLFAIKATNDSAALLNKKGFVAKGF
jgi:hypothetical protein